MISPSRIAWIARREWVEQGRQPAMLATIATLFVAIAALSLAALHLLDEIAGSAHLERDLGQWLPALGFSGDQAVVTLAGTVIEVANWLVFTQFLGITAVLAGHAVLHDRQTGTLPFLLLAPVRRVELLTGKVLGALGPSTALYVAVSGGASLWASRLAVTSTYGDRLPPSPAWAIAFLVGGPVWAACVATLCAIVSSVARDVRTAQQGVWLVMFFATFACGYLLAGLLPDGAAVEAGVALLGVVATAGALVAGSQVISRDLGR